MDGSFARRCRLEVSRRSWSQRRNPSHAYPHEAGGRQHDHYVYEGPPPLPLQQDILWRYDILYHESRGRSTTVSPKMRVLKEDASRPYVDYDLIRTWLCICLDNHSSTCGEAARASTAGTDIWVIDVHTSESFTSIVLKHLMSP
jgi:hypothetical protein